MSEEDVQVATHPTNDTFHSQSHVVTDGISPELNLPFDSPKAPEFDHSAAHSAAIQLPETTSSPVDTPESFPDPPVTPPPPISAMEELPVAPSVNGAESDLKSPLQPEVFVAEPEKQLSPTGSHTSSSDVVSPTDVPPVPSMGDSAGSPVLSNPSLEVESNSNLMATSDHPTDIQLPHTDESVVVGGVHNGHPLVQCVVASEVGHIPPPATDDREIVGGLHNGQPLVQCVVGETVEVEIIPPVPSTTSTDANEVVGGILNGQPLVQCVMAEEELRSQSPTEVEVVVDEQPAAPITDGVAGGVEAELSNVIPEEKSLINGLADMTAEESPAEPQHIDIVVTDVQNENANSPEEHHLQTPSVESELSREVTTPSECSADVVTVIQQIPIATEVIAEEKEKISPDAEKISDATVKPPLPATPPPTADLKMTESIPMIDEGAEELKPVEIDVKNAADIPPETPSKANQNRRAKWSQQIRKRCQIL